MHPTSASEIEQDAVTKFHHRAHTHSSCPAFYPDATALRKIFAVNRKNLS